MKVKNRCGSGIRLTTANLELNDVDFLVHNSFRKTAWILSFVALGSALFSFAYVRPRYFTNQTYLGDLIFLEFMVAAIWQFYRAFFPILISVFLFAGMTVPLAGVWTIARWIFVGVGALIGVFIVLKEHNLRFGAFHVIALFAVVLAAMSSTFSTNPMVAASKAFALFLLFLYAGTGLRSAVLGRERSFFHGLLIGCEVFVAIIAVCYAAGFSPLGNLNSLGAIMALAGVPILSWGVLLDAGPGTRHRRWLLFAVCVVLILHSHARAGWAAVLLSCAIPCLALRKYKVAVQTLTGIIIFISIVGLVAPDTLNSGSAAAVYKGGNAENGVFESRTSPWQAAIHDIREHPWFGSGLGTTANGPTLDLRHPLFASSTQFTTEYGNSYLSILSGVGVIGTIPAVILFLYLGKKSLDTIRWLRLSRTPSHPAVPLAIIVFAGLIHATFEDWMFAPGNYLCVFFWAMAFLLIDLAPSPREFQHLIQRSI